MQMRAGKSQTDAAVEKRILKESTAVERRRGNTMVEVIASFAILVMMAALFANVFMNGSRVVDRTVRLIEEKEALYEAYHLGEGMQAEPAGGGAVRFVPVGGDSPEDGFILDGMEVYAHTSTEGLAGTVYDVGPEGE